jgi:hypothetical protein
MSLADFHYAILLVMGLFATVVICSELILRRWDRLIRQLDTVLAEIREKYPDDDASFDEEEVTP